MPSEFPCSSRRWRAKTLSEMHRRGFFNETYRPAFLSVSMLILAASIGVRSYH